jgi:hypothetical protein
MTPREDPAVVLNRLVNILVTTKEVKVGLIKRGAPLLQDCLKDRWPLAKSRNHIRVHLMEWIKNSGFNGHGTKRLVDKAISKIMAGYKASLHLALAEDRREAKREQKWWLL